MTFFPEGYKLDPEAFIGTMVSYLHLFFVTILRCVVGTSVSYLTCRGHGAREETMCGVGFWTELYLQYRLHTYIHKYYKLMERKGR